MKSTEDKTGTKIGSAKNEYVEKRKAQIYKWNEEIEDLNARITAANANAEAKLAHKEHIATLRQKRDEARAKLTEIEEADDDRWEGLKDGLDHVWTNIKSSLEKIKAKF
jgi:multidrug resistance efflux pump